MHLADAFIQSDLVHSGYTFFCEYVCSLGIEPTTFALLTQYSNHWATGTQYLCSLCTVFMFINKIQLYIIKYY